nr:hypothetical protein [Schaalia suimastitidis]
MAEQREVTLLGCVPTSTKRAVFPWAESPDMQTVSATIAIIGAHVIGSRLQILWHVVEFRFRCVWRSVANLGDLATSRCVCRMNDTGPFGEDLRC